MDDYQEGFVTEREDPKHYGHAKVRISALCKGYGRAPLDYAQEGCLDARDDIPTGSTMVFETGWQYFVAPDVYLR